MIWRPNTDGLRVFPSPEELIQSSSPCWYGGGRSPFGWFKPHSHLARLQAFFWLYRAALLAEMQMQKKRANFYWKDAGIIARRFAKKPKALALALKSLAPDDGVARPEHSEGNISRFVSETLIDGHVASYNAFNAMDDARARERRKFHLSQIVRWLPLTSLTPREMLSFVRPAIHRLSEVAIEGKHWDELEGNYRLALSLNPDDSESKNGLANALFAKAISALKDDRSSEVAAREAKKLKPIILEVEKLALSRPLVAGRFEILSKLYKTLAVRLANAKQCAEALEAIEKASAVSLEDEEVNSIKRHLNELMLSLQMRAAELAQELSRKPGAQLTADGLSIKNQAALGFELARSYRASEAAKQLTDSAEEAKARYFWLALELPERTSDLRAEVCWLSSALDQIASKEPKDALEIHRLWRAQLEREPKLAEIEEEKVVSFLSHVCLGAPWQRAEPKPTDPEPLGNPPQLKIAEGTTVENSVPFWQWFLSCQHNAYRWSCLAATAILLFFGAEQIPGLIHRQKLRKLYGPPVAYSPAYPSTPATDAWIAFRKSRPYPYQTVAVKVLPDNSRVVIISEPPPIFSKSDFDGLLDSIFHGEIASKNRLRWRLGLDGWLEDVVIVLHSEQERVADPMEDPVFRDRIGMLHLALFGTTYGGDVENLGSASPEARPGKACNLQLTARDLRTWVQDSSSQWFPLTGVAPIGRTWAQISADSATQALRSKDGSLIMLTFPTRLLQQAKSNSELLAPLRVPFREFATASDGVIGGIWGKSGQTAILGRVRLKPYTIVPPLRFETFSLLATQQLSEQLSQSFERTTLFAGKLFTGQYRLRDWAPIYLSEPLIDTEFGALLNVTDQMLKSWTEAGLIEYQHFNYPKPDHFAFGKAPLTDILAKKLNSHSLLFNWNTAGSAVMVYGADFSTITVKRTGALPITYGADSKTKAQGGADVFLYEDQAYQYFANLADPCLHRVVQYTLIYQLFRAVAKDSGETLSSGKEEEPASTKISARSKSQAMLRLEAERFINDLLATQGTNQTPGDVLSKTLQEAGAKLKQVLDAYPNSLSKSQLAEVLTNRHSQELQKFYKGLHSALQVKIERYKFLRDEYQKEVGRYNIHSIYRDWSNALLSQVQASIKSKEAALHDLESEIANGQQDPLGELISNLHEIAMCTEDLNGIRKNYIASNDTEPAWAIKTPSVVLSWSSRDMESLTGGHNLDSHALRLEPSASVESIALARDQDGHPVLRYNPAQSQSVEENASEIARTVERTSEIDIEDIKRIVQQKHPVRDGASALELPMKFAPDPGYVEGFGRIGSKFYNGKKPLIDDLRAIAEKNTDSVFVIRDEQQIAYLAAKNIAPPPLIRVLEVRDTPSLIERLSVVTKGPDKNRPKSIIFLGEPEAHVKALALDLQGDSFADTERLASELGRRPFANEKPFSGILGRDFKGRRSLITGISEGVKDWFHNILSRATETLPKKSWSNVNVTELDSRSIEAILKKADWNSSRDGLPTAIKITFDHNPFSGSKEIDILAGFRDLQGKAAKETLFKAHNEAVAFVPEKGGSIAEYFATLRSSLKELPQQSLKSLVLVVHDKESKALFTRISSPRESRSDG